MVYKTAKEYWHAQYEALQKDVVAKPLSMKPAYLSPEIANPIIEKIIRLSLANTKEPILECEKHNYYPTLHQREFWDLIAERINEKRGLINSCTKIYRTNPKLRELFLELGDEEVFISKLILWAQRDYNSEYKSNMKPNFGIKDGYNLYSDSQEILHI